MKTREYTYKYGKLKTFDLLDEISEPVSDNELAKPSLKTISKLKKSKKGHKIIRALMDLSKNNNSWYQELKKRAEKSPDSIALFYRGTKVTFKEMFEKSDSVAKTLVKMGIKKGDEIPACLANTPELVYIMLGANKIGAKLNLFGTHLDNEYLNEILDNCSNKLFIATDDFYPEIKDVISSRYYKNKVLISLANSLPKHPEETDEYEPSLAPYYHYENKAQTYIQEDNSLIDFNNFLAIGSDYLEPIVDTNNLDTEFLITYTSGSTAIGRPKQIVHSNRSLITSGRFHDPELAGNPEIKGLRGLAHIHTESNTDLITCISDNLFQLWTVALEPEYDKDKALDYVILNKPNYLNITKSFLVNMSKQYLVEKRHHQDGTGRKLPFLLAAFAVGEGVSKGEEKLINTFLRKSKAGSGVKIKGFSMPYTTLCVGGGDCEHGGIYYSLWRSTFEKINYLKLQKHEYGLMPEAYVQVGAFKEGKNGIYEECNYNECGLIAANSATTMVRYKGNPQKTQELIITDTLGRDWISSNVYGYIDELGGVHVKGRWNNNITLTDNTELPSCELEELVSLDTKNILSCVVTQYADDNNLIPIINLEFQPDKKVNTEKTINALLKRCSKILPPEDLKKLGIRVFDNKTSFPLTGAGKRNVPAIVQMGLENVFYPEQSKLDSLAKPKVKTLTKKLLK